MICASCRTVNLDGMVFCAKCGRGLVSTNAPPCSPVQRSNVARSAKSPMPSEARDRAA